MAKDEVCAMSPYRVQMMLDGVPVKNCKITVKTDDGTTVKVAIGGVQAKKVVEAIVDIVCNEKKADWTRDGGC